VTLVDISAVRADFCMKFFIAVKHILYCLQSFIKIYLKPTKLCCFNQDNPPPHFSAFRPFCWWWDEDADLLRYTELLQMLKVTTAGSHSQSSM